MNIFNNNTPFNSFDCCYYTLVGLDVQQTEDLVSGIAIQTLRLLYEKYDGNMIDFGKNVDKIIKSIMKGHIDLAKDYQKKMPGYAVSKTSIESNPYAVFNKVKDFLSYYGLTTKVLAEDLEEEINYSELSIEEKANRLNEFGNANEVSNLDNMANEVKLLIGTLYEKELSPDGRYREKLNSVGLPTMIDFSTAYVRLLDTLNGTFEWDSIMDKIKDLAKKYPEYDALVNRLNKLVPGSANEMFIKTKFRQAMSINKYKYYTYVTNEDGGRFVESSMSRTIDRLREQLDSSYKKSSVYKESIEAANIKTFNENFKAELDAASKIMVSSNSRAKRAILEPILIKLGFDEILNVDTLVSTTWGDFFIAMSDIFSNNSLITDLSEFKTGRLKSVLTAEALSRKELFEPSHLNSKNKTVYEFSLNNYYSTVVNEIVEASKKPTYTEKVEYLYRKLPHLKQLEGKSTWLDEILRTFYSKKPIDLSIAFLEGMRENISGAEGEIAFDLSPTDLFKMHVEATLRKYSKNGDVKPIFTLRRPSDKSLEPAIVGFRDSDPSFLIDNFAKYVQWDLETTGLKQFADILGEDLVDSINKNGTSSRVIKDKIFDAFMKFIEEESLSNIQLAKELKLINEKGHLFSKEIFEQNYNLKTAEDILRAYTREYVISRIEQHMIFLGDFGQFKQLFKRTSGATGTKKTFATDNFINEFVQKGYRETLNKVDPATRLDLVMKLSKSDRQSLGLNQYLDLPETMNSSNITILKDFETPATNYLKMYEDFIKKSLIKDGFSEVEASKKAAAYMKEYKKMTVADGLGYINFEHYREFMIKVGDWNYKTQEPVYQKIINGEKITIQDIGVFPTIKPQGFGPKAFANVIKNGKITREEFDKMTMAFAKLSLMPLIPTVIKGTDLEKLDKSMKMSGVNMAIYESGLKDTNHTNVEDFYSNTDVRMLSSFNQSNSFWGIQVDMHDEIEESDIDGTQQRVQLWQDLFDGGIPIDYVGETDWNDLSDNQKIAESPLYKLFKDYSTIYDNILSKSRKKLVEELGLEAITNGNGVTYKIVDKNKFLKELRKEIIARRLPDNILEALQLDSKGNFKYPIDALPMSDKIENILFARAINNTIKIKRPGAAYVQTSSLLWRSEAEKLKFVEITENGQKIKAAEVLLPNYMRHIIGDVTDLNKIDNRLLKLMGYRIPTQGQNSMLPLVVAGFLPAEFGDTVVVPWEIVAQSGSDFDIDKLHIFRPNFKPSFDSKSEKAWIDFIKDLNVRLRGLGEDSYVFAENIEGVEELNDFITYLNTRKEDELSTVEEFIKSSLAKVQLASGTAAYIEGKIDGSIKEMQNKLLEIQLEVLANPLVGRNLLVPNGATFLKEEAAFTEWLRETTDFIPPHQLTKDNPKFIKWKETVYDARQGSTAKQLLSAKYELETGMTFKLGKKLVAVFANYNKFHTLCQQNLVSLSGILHKQKWIYTTNSNISDMGFDLELILNFNCNKNESGNAVLGRRFDETKFLISNSYKDLISTAMSNYEPDVFTALNINMLTADVACFLMALGVRTDLINRFLTQPIINEYLHELALKKSIVIQSSIFKENVFIESEGTILRKLHQKYSGRNIYSNTNIKEEYSRASRMGNKLTLEILNAHLYQSRNISILPYKNREEYGKIQIQVLGDFLNYSEYSKEFYSGILSVKTDTKRLKSTSDAWVFMENIRRVEDANFFNGLDRIRNQGILKPFSKSHAPFLKSLFKDVFVTEMDFIQSNIYNKLRQNALVGNNSTLTEKEITRLRQSILTYLLQQSIADKYYGHIGVLSVDEFSKLLIGANSIPRFYHSFKNLNVVVRNFIYTKTGSDYKSIDMLKIQGKRVHPVTANTICRAIDKLGEPLWHLIFQVNSIQTGYVYSPINFLNYINSCKLGDIFGSLLRSITEENYTTNFGNFDSLITNFLLINRKISNLVPSVFPDNKLVRFSEDHDILTISSKHPAYGKKIVKTNYEGYVIKNNKRVSVKHDITYKLEAADLTNALYLKINPKGNYFLQEYHNGYESIDKNLKDTKCYISLERRNYLLRKLSLL